MLVLLGDMNLDAETWTDPKSVPKALKDKVETFQERHGLDFHPTGHTFEIQSKSYQSTLDHVYSSQDLEVEVQVLYGFQDRKVTDHYPIMVEI